MIGVKTENKLKAVNQGTGFSLSPVFLFNDSIPFIEGPINLTLSRSGPDLHQQITYGSIYQDDNVKVEPKTAQHD